MDWSYSKEFDIEYQIIYDDLIKNNPIIDIPCFYKDKFQYINKKWIYNKYYYKLICEFLKRYNKSFISYYNITYEELQTIIITDDLYKNFKLIKESKIYKAYHDQDKNEFHSFLYFRLFNHLGFNMLRDIITTLNYDSYIDLIKIIRSIVIYEYCKDSFLKRTTFGIRFEQIFEFNNLSFFTILYQFVNNKDKEYKIYDLAGNIIYTFDFIMIKNIKDLIKCIRILNDSFTIIIDGYKFKSVKYLSKKYLTDFPDNVSLLTEIPDIIQDKIIQIIIHPSSDSNSNSN